MKTVTLTDEAATELGIEHLARLGTYRWRRNYVNDYDVRRVRRALRRFKKGWHKMTPAHRYLNLSGRRFR